MRDSIGCKQNNSTTLENTDWARYKRAASNTTGHKSRQSGTSRQTWIALDTNKHNLRRLPEGFENLAAHFKIHPPRALRAFQDSTGEGLSHPSFLSFMWYRASIAEAPFAQGGIAPQVRPHARGGTSHPISSNVVRGLLGTGPPHPTLESASPSPPQRSIWHRNRVRSANQCRINVESMSSRCQIDP